VVALRDVAAGLLRDSSKALDLGALEAPKPRPDANADELATRHGTKHRSAVDTERAGRLDETDHFGRLGSISEHNRTLPSLLGRLLGP
jgi:hypothetical protein